MLSMKRNGTFTDCFLVHCVPNASHLLMTDRRVSEPYRLQPASFS